MDTPPWLHRCELSVWAQPASQDKRAVPSIVPRTSVLSLVPKHLYTRQISQSFMQPEEEDRCLTPEVMQTLWIGCAVFHAGQENRARPAVRLLGDTAATLYPSVPSSITLIKQQRPHVPVFTCCGYTAD